MRTISQVVEEIIIRSPFLSETIVEGVANNAQIARRIKPAVEARLLEKVSDSAISAAIHRMSKNLQAPLFGFRFLKQVKGITVRSNLVEFVFHNSEEIPDFLETISKKARGRKDTFVNFSRGIHESLLVIDDVLAKESSDIILKHKKIIQINNLSAITLRLPEESLNVPGLYYPLLKALAFDGISFVEIMSVRTELSILFEDKDVDLAFSTLKHMTS